MNERFEESLKNRRRQLSRFMARELLLDYAQGQLDPQRRAALEEYLPTCKDTQKELESLKAALAYTEQLGKIHVADTTVQQIETTKLGWAKWSDRVAWRNWPEMARWTAEAVGVAAIVAIFVSLFPIQKLSRWLPSMAQELILAEVEKTEAEKREEAYQETVDTLARTTPEPEATVPEPPAEPEKAQAPALPAPAKVKDKAKIPVADKADAETAPTPAPKGAKGFVYRAFMSSSKIDDTTGQVKELIHSLGGEKAGQVELGWRKNSGTYFHFALPESNYEDLLSSLRTFSPVRIYKDPHWRVMPEGQIRLILFIEDKGPKN